MYRPAHLDSASHPVTSAPASASASADRAWLRSSFCQGAADTCVDVQLGPGGVGVRDSKDLDGPVLRFTPEEWEAFLLGVRNGEFELPLI
ncbi:DUF397 domain-containing protein [Parafrankia sp. EUN1f]|uniref:DUF397 domain-containing protein n=1 Tax=Parafrankia sp. EUN1f TaxID=102897 RepID=UPI0001C45EA1|nr:DUF397 domain-containing protein [Parafrankia sp. EUN1f]EFC82297.1 protein of unknown function DUF397 [Parafrankia sp. EUN1f]